MKKTFVIIIIVVIVLVLGFFGWQFLFKKSSENGSCKSANNCEEGLKCVGNICSSGKAGSVCAVSKDCSSSFCVKGKCTEGKKGEVCSTYKDCEKGLFCQKEICSAPPSYSQYFNKIVISKMKVGIPPGPDNMPVITTDFKTTDALEIDFIGVKAAANGEIYYDVVNQITGEVVFSSIENKMKLTGRDIGTGSDLPRIVGGGNFDLNIYYNKEMVYTTPIKITE